jgi:hypothetical protein
LPSNYLWRPGEAIDLRSLLPAEQVERFHLSELPGKESDPRAEGFVDRHGRLAQVEFDALATRVHLFR